MYPSLDSPNHVRPHSHSYFPRKLCTFYPAPCDTHYPNYPPLPWISSHPFAILFKRSSITCLFTPHFHFSHYHKRQMYPSRLCDVPTSPPPFLLFSQQCLPLTTKVLEPDGTDMAATPHLTTTCINSRRNFVDQVREQGLSRTARERRVVRVCIREYFYLRFTTGV